MERACVASSLGLPSWDELAALRTVSADPAPSATVAMQETMGKMFIEQPMLDLVARPGMRSPSLAIDWLGLSSRALTPLGEPSLALLRLKTGRSDVTDLATELARSAAADSLRNEMTMHRVIHGWLGDPTSGMTALPSLNERVYTEIFLTPASDPWLGLRAADVWDAIESAGR